MSIEGLSLSRGWSVITRRMALDASPVAFWVGSCKAACGAESLERAQRIAFRRCGLPPQYHPMLPSVTGKDSDDEESCCAAAAHLFAAEQGNILIEREAASSGFAAHPPSSFAACPWPQATSIVPRHRLSHVSDDSGLVCRPKTLTSSLDLCNAQPPIHQAPWHPPRKSLDRRNSRAEHHDYCVGAAVTTKTDRRLFGCCPVLSDCSSPGMLY